MSDLLKDKLNLQLLSNICSGEGVQVNINELSRILKKHRNTIRERVTQLFDHTIISKPSYPFSWLYNEYPLMIIARADFPRDDITGKFIEEDPHIFAAFFKKDEEYNTLLIEYHKDLYSYLIWSDAVIHGGKLPPQETRYPTDAMFFSNQTFIKYNPEHLIFLIENDYDKIQRRLSGYELDNLSLEILKKLMNGQGIQTNEYVLAERLNIHRKTVERRICALLKENIITPPVCRFPRFVVPPDYTLVISLVELKKQHEQVEKAWQNDPHIPLVLRASTGRYTHLLFSSFYLIKDHIAWEEKYNQEFSGCIGAIKNTYLSPSMMFSIDHQFVALEIIKHRLDIL
jgi:DNA-binding Lrp family transcriptional regulator